MIDRVLRDKYNLRMARKGEGSSTNKIGLIMAALTFLVVLMVAFSLSGLDVIEIIAPTPEEVAEWETFILGNWEFTDIDGGAQYFQFHENGRYDYFLQVNPQGGGFGDYRVIEATEDRATLQMTPAADPSQRWELYMWRRDSSNIDIRMGSPDGENFTRLTRK